MNDRFKYRVWDNNKNEYVSPFVFINYHAELCANETRCFYPGHENCIIEQCTGLRDRNGKLIYEGDVVEVYNPLTDANNQCVVKWEDDAAGYVCIYLEPGKVARGCANASPTGTYLDGAYCEIVGNIHMEGKSK